MDGEPGTETIVLQVSAHEHQLIVGFAAMRGMSASDLVRELLGFDRRNEATRHLRLVPTKSEGGGRPGAHACLP